MRPIVTDQVAWSVTLVSPSKTAEPIKMLFGLGTWVDPGSHVLDGGYKFLYGKGQFLSWGRGGQL